MTFLAAMFIAAAALVRPPAARGADARRAELVPAVRSADYRGDRAELARLDAELGKLPDGPLSEYRDYWRGFALWRRVLNGFNATPTPDDLTADAEGAIARFKSALSRHPDWIEAKLAMVGCWGNLIYLAGKDEARRQAILNDAKETFLFIMQNAGDNPRALWIKGGMQMAAPPPTGGDFVKAAETLRHGVACAWREALAHASSPVPPWEPTWGGPENLMNLAFAYSRDPKNPDRAAALAYAEGALTAVPEWHYVRDVLLPKIEAMPVNVAEAAAPKAP